MLDLSEVKGGSLSLFLQRLDLSEVRKSFYTGFVPDTINRKGHFVKKKTNERSEFAETCKTCKNVSSMRLLGASGS
jgi:hypothetical protein